MTQVTYSLEDLSRYCERKSKWAYQELKSFLRYAQEQGISAHDVTGSMSAAIGYPQFMPSNIELYAQDGDGDGQIDLYNHADAQASIGRYLESHGWHDGLFYSYNKSKTYVTTILSLAAAMKE